MHLVYWSVVKTENTHVWYTCIRQFDSVRSNQLRHKQQKLIFISTTSGTYDKCRAFSTRDEERRSHFVYTEGFTTQVRVLPRWPGRIVQNLTEQRDVCIRNDVGYVTKAGETCLQLFLWWGRWLGMGCWLSLLQTASREHIDNSLQQ